MNPLDSDNLAAKRLRACRLGARETLAQIGALAGVHKSTVLRWERGDTSKINRPTLRLLAEHFDVDPAWLLGRDEPEPAAESRTRPVPILGTVRGGVGGVAEEEILGYEPADASRFGKGEDFFWLRVTGDSMAPCCAREIWCLSADRTRWTAANTPWPWWTGRKAWSSRCSTAPAGWSCAASTRTIRPAGSRGRRWSGCGCSGRWRKAAAVTCNRPR